MKNFFLFAREPESDWTRGRRLAYYMANAILLVGTSACLGALALVFAIGAYPLPILRGYLESLPLLLLNVLPVVWLCLLLYALLARAWAAFLGTSVFISLLTLGNYFKLVIRDDPVIARDVKDLFMAVRFGATYEIQFDFRMVFAAFCIVFAIAVLALFARARIGGRARIACVLFCAVTAFPLWHFLTDDALYDRLTDTRHINQWSTTQVHVVHGCVYPFLHSIPDAFDVPPEGYSKAETAELISAFEESAIPEDRRVDIISIMLEAYSDFSRFDIDGVDFSAYDLYHALEEESYTGTLITNIFAGGTIDSERAFLTGYPTVPEMRSNIPSYVWYLRSQGYTAEGSHPCYEWFYNRQNVNEYLGFENYYFMENHYNAYTNHVTAPDSILMPEILRLYDAAKESGKPYFSFNVTYQGHGPYSAEAVEWDADYVTGYDDVSRNILNNYLGSIADTNQKLTALVDALRAQSEPVVLVLFGDHKPWLGDGNSVYHALGINIDLSTPEGFSNYYATRYLIWANDAAKALLGNDFCGEGPTISPCYLMSEVFALCGFEGNAYMQAMNDVKSTLPVITTNGRYMESGALTDALSSEGRTALQRAAALEYYQRNQKVLTEDK